MNLRNGTGPITFGVETKPDKSPEAQTKTLPRLNPYHERKARKSLVTTE